MKVGCADFPLFLKSISDIVNDGSCFVVKNLRASHGVDWEK